MANKAIIPCADDRQNHWPWPLLQVREGSGGDSGALAATMGMGARVGIEAAAGAGGVWASVGGRHGHRWKSRAGVVGLGPGNARPAAPAVETRTCEPAPARNGDERRWPGEMTARGRCT